MLHPEPRAAAAPARHYRLPNPDRQLAQHVALGQHRMGDGFDRARRNGVEALKQTVPSSRGIDFAGLVMRSQELAGW